MRRVWLTLPAAAAFAAIALSGCDKPPPAAPNAKTITIQTAEAPAPKAAPMTGGKLAVMDGSTQPESVPPASTAVVPAPSGEATAAAPRPGPGPDPREDADYRPQRDGDAEFDPAGPTPRDCRQAERRGDALADSRVCRDFRDEAAPPPPDPGLIADCRDAERVGDPFADTRVCRRVLDR